MQHTMHRTLPAHTDAWLQEASAFTTPPPLQDVPPCAAAPGVRQKPTRPRSWRRCPGKPLRAVRAQALDADRLLLQPRMRLWMWISARQMQY